MQPETAQQQQPQTQAAEAADLKKFESLLDQVLAKTERQRGEINLLPRGLEFGNFEGLQRWANVILDSEMAPKGFKLSQIIVAIVYGRTVGLDPFQSVRSIAVVNGRPFLWGDAPLSIARQHKEWDEEGFEEFFEVNGKRVDGAPDPASWKDPSFAAVCKSKRKTAKVQKVTRFSVGHATAAGLLGKSGNLYSGYLQRMLMFRARGYQLRDNFGDALMGIGIKELDDGEAAAPEPPRSRVEEKLHANGSHKAELPPPSTPAIQQQPLPEQAPAQAAAALAEGEIPSEPEAPVSRPDLQLQAEESDRKDTIQRIGASIAGCKSTKELESGPGVELTRNADWLGREATAALMQTYQTKFRALQGEPVASGGRRRA